MLISWLTFFTKTYPWFSEQRKVIPAYVTINDVGYAFKFPVVQCICEMGNKDISTKLLKQVQLLQQKCSKVDSDQVEFKLAELTIWNTDNCKIKY